MTVLRHFDDSNFQQDVLQASEQHPVLVDFWAPWCGPCRIVGPTIENVANATEGQAIVGKLNVDDAPETAAKYSIQSIPTVLVFHEGRVVDSFVGVRPEEDYLEALRRAAASRAA